MRTAFAISNYFIEKDISESQQVSPMKLQKMLYFSYGWYSAIKNDTLFKEHFQAWAYGPVVSEVYHEVKKYGNNSITSLISNYFGDESDMFSFKLNTPKIKDDNIEFKAFLHEMWNIYSKHSAIALSEMTHIDGSPWKKTIENNNNKITVGIEIEYDLIKSYFSEQLREISTKTAV
jgi:uncharacterized phage-associated protein